MRFAGATGPYIRIQQIKGAQVTLVHIGATNPFWIPELLSGER